MEKLVSVIIPVFNTDIELVKKCLRSIRMQDYRNLEIIIVDDGSESMLAKKYDALKANDIYVIHQKNMGVSVARNRGVEIANGEFITFVDADDYLAPFAIHRGVHLIEKENVDMVIGAVEKIIALKNDICENVINRHSYVIFSNEEEYSELRNMCLNCTPDKYRNINGKGEILRGPVARIMRTCVARETSFPRGILLGEDVIWNMRLLKKCKSICIDFNVWYYYAMNLNSALHRYYGNRSELVTDYLQLLLKENPEIQGLYSDALLRNMAVEFYCILNYDWMSSQCPMSYKEKIEAARKLLQCSNWKILSANYLSAPIPVIYKIFIALAKCGIWPLPLKIYNYLKTVK